uniref:WD40 repeat n=1 Tax=Candidatus Kentrum sp. MB TaxID=2138164 RepID=A0A450XSB5_9GAMM|nr:MAG: WD40 repeat [Candidatus Kentron sp. MB]VFK74180.1 MAG: WD40 repeat [Candidatus Kentron sp. MB]
MNDNTKEQVLGKQTLLEKVCPFVGLDVITEEKRLFGREDEVDSLSTQVRTRRCSVMYGSSGVGKSSLLYAGLIPDLKKTEDRLANHAYVSIQRTWNENPIGDLYRQVFKDSHEQQEPPPWDRSSETDSEKLLTDLIEKLADKGPIYLILDQFEELFNFEDKTGQGAIPRKAFLDTLIEIANNRNLGTNVLLSLRSDSLNNLRILQHRLPKLLNDPFVVEPISAGYLNEFMDHAEEYVALASGSKITLRVDKSLRERLLRSGHPNNMVSPWNLLEHTGFGYRQDGNDPGYIDLPYLQLVMQRLWQQATDEASDTSTLRLSEGDLDAVGNVRGIISDYVRRCLMDKDKNEQKQNKGEKDLTAHLFENMVTESYKKVAQTPNHLAKLCENALSTCKSCLYKISDKNESEDWIQGILDCLTNHPSRRLLRRITMDSESSSVTAYTLYHDRLAEPIWDWSHNRLETIRKRIEREKRQRRENKRLRVEAIRKRIKKRNHLIIVTICIFIIIAIIFGIGYWLIRKEQKETIVKSLVSGSQVEKETGSSRVALATEALLRNPRNSEAANALRDALAVTWPGAPSQETGTWPSGAKNSFNIPTTETCPKFVPSEIGDKTGEIRAWLAPIQAGTDRRVWIQQTIAPVSRNTTLTIADCHSGRALMEESIEHRVIDVDFGPEGKRLAILTADNRIRAWRFDPFALDFTHIHPTLVKRVGFDEDGKLLRLIDVQGKTKDWLVDNSGGVSTLPVPNASSPLPNDEKIAYAQDATLWILNLANGGARRSLGSVPDGEINDIRFSPDGQAIYLGARYLATKFDEDEPVLMYDWNFYHHHKFAISYKGKVFAEREPTTLAFHPSRDSFAMARRDGSVALCDYTKQDAQSSCFIQYIEKPNANIQQRMQWTALAFAGEEILLGGASSGELRRWDLGGNTYKDVTVTADNSAIHEIQAGLAGERVALITADEKTRLWTLQDGVLRHERDLDGIVAFSRDGQTMAWLTEDKTLWLERGAGSAARFPIEERKDVGIDAPKDIALSPDGSYLAVLDVAISGHDKRITLYSTETRQFITAFQAPLFATTLEFSNHRYLNVTDSIGESHLMPWKPEDLIALARERYLDEEMKPGEGLCQTISKYLPESQEPELCSSAPSPEKSTPPSLSP